MKLFVMAVLAMSILTVVRDQSVRFWPKKWKDNPEQNVSGWFKLFLQGFGCISSLFGLTILPFVFILTFAPVWQWWAGTVAFVAKVTLSLWIYRTGGEKKVTKIERDQANILTFVMWAYMLWYILG